MAAEISLVSRAEYAGLHASLTGQASLSFGVKQVNPSTPSVYFVSKLVSFPNVHLRQALNAMLPMIGCRQTATLDLMRLHEWAA